MTNPENDFPPHIPPEEEACLQIMVDYQQGRLALEEAAPKLIAAFQALGRGINLEISPSIRRLFVEMARLEGRPAPFLGPDPDRHKRRGADQDLAEKAWRAVSRHPGANQPLSIRFHIAAATESRARAIVAWLESHGQQGITLESPVEGDADDWTIWASTPETQFTREEVERWVAMIQRSPFGNEASFMGWSF